LSAAPPCGDILARMMGSAEVRSSFLDDSLSVLSRSPPSAPPIPHSAEVDFLHSTEKKRFQFGGQYGLRYG
jgi:hypothetical protein